MPDCQDQDRRNLILSLAQTASIQAVQELQEHAVRKTDEPLIAQTQIMLEQILEYKRRLKNQNGIYADVNCIPCSAVEVNTPVYYEDAQALEPWHKNLEWTGSHFVKTEKTVLAKGVPLRVGSGACKIEDCPSCFYENICEREETKKLIDRSHALIESIKRLDKKHNANVAIKAVLDREKQAVKDADEAYNIKRRGLAYIG